MILYKHCQRYIFFVPPFVLTFGVWKDKPVVFVFGSMSHGDIMEEALEYTERALSFSQYPLSAAYAIGRLTNAFENKWNIV